MDGIDNSRQCPACGSTLSKEPASVGLCPGCILELALESPSLLAELEAEAGQPTLTYREEAFQEGQVLGQRYRIRALLGRGGMGEVWRATDLKLRVDVALKALRQQLLADTHGLETLRQEVRAAREVVSPNVCRVFDLVEAEGQELVSMEYIDGITLLDILKMRAPLDLSEAREVAAQFLAGLEAIHDAGLVHRDIKPENLMMTRSGRVVLMDFGIAKGLTEDATGTVSGTPAYMSPEQARGESLDARADVFSAGVVLTEMISPGGLRTLQARQEIWQGAHQQPPKLPDIPWRPVLKTALSARREHRYASAAALARALEEVTLRVAGAEEFDPYPGLAAFTEDDAEYFFGRELEVEAMWRKLQRPHLLGLIGPSGTGKSSFLRAGLLPAMPTGWRAILVTPGNEPFSNFARALVPELTGDTEALQLLTRSDDAASLIEAARSWRRNHSEVLVILDQFEELFTQTPPETQQRFAALLGRLALEADVHVLLAMRDDFLAYCSHYEDLAPLFSELTPLKPLAGAALRRSLVQPALKCGYKFEDEALVDTMLADVADERGALPLLAFAAARLWEHRDREQGLLTRAAYEHIGGVAGALAKHAEKALERIGQTHIPIVRELLRNLVTAKGTRAARDRDELLSVFSTPRPTAGGARGLRQARHEPRRFEASDPGRDPENREAAAEVLDALIDARLLTSYEVPAADEEREPRHKVEIIHESLLSNWPRLVRWQTQDADSAQLRDQLRQAAQMWIDRGRPQDLLWTGTSFEEYRLWRERYEGGLSTTEVDFGHAMTNKAERHRRQRRLAVVAAFALLLTILAIVGFSRQQAVAAARRAEAQKLLALGQVELETSPTVALAYATSSLELSDTPEARTFLLQALAAGPPARVLPAGEGDRMGDIAFSPDGAWGSLRGFESLRVVSRDGATDVTLEPFPPGRGAVFQAFDDSGRYLFGAKNEELRVWSLPELELVDRQALPPGRTVLRPGPSGTVTVLKPTEDGTILSRASVGRPIQEIDRIETIWSNIRTDPSSRWLAYPFRDQVLMRSLEDWSAPARTVGAPHATTWIGDFVRDRIATKEASAQDWKIRVWSTRPGATEPLRTLPPLEFELNGLALDPARPRLAVASQASEGPRIDVWDLEAPAESVARSFLGTLPGTEEWINEIAFDPTGSWLAAAAINAVAFWPLAREEPWVLVGHRWPIWDLAFTPDGHSLVTRDNRGNVLIWDLETGGASRVLASGIGQYGMLDIDRNGRFVALSQGGGVAIVPLDGGPIRNLEGFRPDTLVVPVAVDATGRLVAAGARSGPRDDKVIRVWDLENGDVWMLGPTEDAGEVYEGQFGDLAFLPDGTLLSAGDGGLRLWSVTEGTNRLLGPSWEQSELAVFDGGRSVAYISGTLDAPETKVMDLDTGVTRPIPSHGGTWTVAVDRSGTLLASGGGWDGVARIGAMSGEEPHLLVGHERGGNEIAISPDGRWVATGGADRTVRLWPMPDVSQPPLHTLPHDDLLAKLRSWTNVRVVPDEEAATGWKVEVGPFPGWEEAPEW